MNPLYGRALAWIYIAAWLMWLCGLVIIISGHSQGLVIFVPGVLVETAFAVFLHRRDPEATDRAEMNPIKLTPWQVSWYHVMFGIELRRAWRIARSAPSPTPGKRPCPKTRHKATPTT